MKYFRPLGLAIAFLLFFGTLEGVSNSILTGSQISSSFFTEAWAKKKKKKKSSKSKQTHHLSLSSLGTGNNFVVPPAIQVAVDFWKMVYSEYDRNYEIFHDTQNLGVIYSVLNFTELYSDPTLTRKDRLAVFRPRLAAEEQRIKKMLLRIHENQYQVDKLSKEERRIFNLFKDDPNPNKFLEAANEKRIRAQTGIKNKFVQAVQTSGAYIEEFEKIFINEGVPAELTRMAFVESMFNAKARSKVGASGMWQFMPGTGRLFGLAINRYVDERNDPFLAARAAARLLKSNYAALGTWPLAINAYNSGRATLRRAVSSTGTTDIATIIQNYRGGVYGFASRNFYPSFLAALEVSNNYPKYFGKLPPDPKLEYETYVLQNPANLSQLANAAGVEEIDLIEYNPQYQNAIHQGRLKIPAGYGVRIPKGTQSQFAQAERLLRQSN